MSETDEGGVMDIPDRPARRNYWVALIPAVLILAWLVGTGIQIARALTPAIPQQTAAQQTVEARLVPRDFVELALSTPARAEMVLVQEGDVVQAGQVLLRLDSYEQRLSAVAAAELQTLLAQQALDELYRQSGVALAQAQLAWQQAEDQRLLAQSRFSSLRRSKTPERIAQAHANLLLAEKRLADRQEDQRKARRLFENHRSLVWHFLSRAKFRQKLIYLDKAVAYEERLYWDAKEKLDDLLAPLDPIDLAQAEAALTQAEAQLAQAERQRRDLLNGPDPDDVEAAQARLMAAQANLGAAKTALQASEIIAPISGVVVKQEIKTGEWAASGRRLLVIADLSEWLLETQDLDEKIAAQVNVGQSVSIHLDAYPEQPYSGTIETISSYYEENDGEIFYETKIGLEEVPENAYWGMTARLEFED